MDPKPPHHQPRNDTPPDTIGIPVLVDPKPPTAPPHEPGAPLTRRAHGSLLTKERGGRRRMKRGREGGERLGD
ncbi:hypothetical protein [Vulcanisaeta distributa]|uniref:hypothetical protein n=1 Tax=Vulcanisaeta distributa TaxID=164451 RepID=UPI001FB3D0A5|nr:hypothetical protein [Vulcanisaeta distributa]